MKCKLCGENIIGGAILVKFKHLINRQYIDYGCYLLLRKRKLNGQKKTTT